MPSERTKQQARNALKGLKQIARAERLIHGSYISDTFDPDRSGAICQGHKACLIGSLWLGAGVPVTREVGHRDLPGVRTYERTEFLRRRPGLRLAYEALNACATRRVAALQRKHPRSEAVRELVEYINACSGDGFSPAEAWFEHGQGVAKPRREDIIALATAAERAVARV